MANDQGMDGERIELTAPFGVARCVERLLNRHQKRKFWAWDWQTRLAVDVEESGEGTVRFRLRRVDRNSLLAVGSLVEVRGVLRAVGDSQTMVRAETSWSPLWIAIHLLLFTWFGVAVSFMLNGLTGPQPLDGQAALRAALTGTIGLLAGGWFTWWWGRRHLREMLRVLREAVGVVDDR